MYARLSGGKVTVELKLRDREDTGENNDKGDSQPARYERNYLEQAIDGIRNLWGKRCIQYVHVFSKPGDKTTNRSRIKEGQWGTHHSTQHHYVHLASSQPTAQLRCQIAEKARHRYNIRHG